MDRLTLLSRLERPCRAQLNVETWRAAAVLAGLRVATNDPIRRQDRDRGEDKNWLADIWGTLGELVAVRVLRHYTKTSEVEHHPIDFDKPVDDVDVKVEMSDGPLLLETKTHMIEHGKNWFMVNERAHARSQARGATGYMPIITALGAHHSLVGSLIPMDEMQDWGHPTVRLKDPAIGVRIGDIAESHFGRSLPEIVTSIEPTPPLVSRSELDRVAARAGQDIESWRGRLPSLEKMPTRYIVATINRLLDESD
jgi:hypothetical protein